MIAGVTAAREPSAPSIPPAPTPQPTPLVPASPAPPGTKPCSKTCNKQILSFLAYFMPVVPSFLAALGQERTSGALPMAPLPPTPGVKERPIHECPVVVVAHKVPGHSPALAGLWHLQVLQKDTILGIVEIHQQHTEHQRGLRWNHGPWGRTWVSLKEGPSTPGALLRAGREGAGTMGWCLAHRSPSPHRPGMEG